MKNKRPKFNCDVNGAIMVTCALRYSLGRMTYVPGAIQDWIKYYWHDLDSNTKCIIVRDIFEYLYDEFRTSSKHEALFDGYDIKEWEKFVVDRYWLLDDNERKYIDKELKSRVKDSIWFTDWMMPKLYDSEKYKRLEALQKLSDYDQELGLE
jgi:hypothetical protein